MMSVTLLENTKSATILMKMIQTLKIKLKETAILKMNIANKNMNKRRVPGAITKRK